MAYALTCTGSSTTVNITNAFSSNLNAGSTIKFSINSLFSPPTTELIDQIIVTTYNSTNKIDSSSSYITNLTAKQMNLTISSPTGFVINNVVIIDFVFTVVDTISRANNFIITFPSGSIVNYQASLISNLVTGSSVTAIGSYNSSTLQLAISQPSNSSNINSQTQIRIRVQSYRTPSSVRVTESFFVRVVSGSGLKMEGSSTIRTLPKAYTGTVSTGNTLINSLTSYTPVFNLADEISSTGYFTIKIPSELTFSGSVTVQLTGSSINSSPGVSFLNSTTIALRNLNISSSNIPIQNISIRINGLNQPSSVKNISNFVIQIYFSNNNDLVA